MKLAKDLRASELIAQMTLDEKLAQITSCTGYELMQEQQLDLQKVSCLLSNGIGQVSRLGGDTYLDPVGVARAANVIQRYLVNETRLGIPAIIHEECCAGYMGLGGTVFPQMLGLAATFEPRLAHEMSAQIRKQLRAIGVHQGLAPVLDIARDPRWGRVEETFGEDPTLVTQFGLAYVNGLQGSGPDAGGILATGKHFVGYGVSQGGLNCAPTPMGQRDLWETHLMPFQAAIRDADLRSIMNSYAELDGDVVAASPRIMRDLLRQDLGFSGLVVSDYEALSMIHTYHRAAPDLQTASALALAAGIDVELPTRKCYGDPLRAALDAGDVSIDLVDHAVEKILEQKISLGLFVDPYVDENQVYEVFDNTQNRALALEIAGKSMVLLKNDGLLPLSKKIDTLAVIGPNANDARALQCDYSFAASFELTSQGLNPGSYPRTVDTAHIAAHSVHVPTVLDSLRASYPDVNLIYERGCDHKNDDRNMIEAAVTAATQADAVVLVLGDRSGLTPNCTTGETRDSANLRLPGAQEALAEAVLRTGKPVVIVLVTGRPYALPESILEVSAILEAWLPGEEGGTAIAATLFGDVNPAGRLPISIPRHVGQLPVYYNQKPSGGHSNWYVDYTDCPVGPLFPFGHGLSYTSFSYDQFSVQPPQACAGEIVTITCQVTNTGALAGEEVVQLYTCDEYASIPRPIQELKGFARIKLEPGQSGKVSFYLPIDQLAFFDIDMKLVVESGRVKVMLGGSSNDIRCEGSFEIRGEPKTRVISRVFTCPVDVQIQSGELAPE
jgi:beta-glucosidase